MHARARLTRAAEAYEAEEAEEAKAVQADPLADLESFFEKQLVIVGGFGAGSSQGPVGGKAQQWRSMWDAFKQYGDGGDPAKEEIERARGCNHYCGDCHALTMATASGSPQWSQLQFGPEAHELMQRTGHSITSLQQGGRLLLFGGRNLQREGGSAEMNDAWLLELLPARGAPLLRELFAAGSPPSARAHHSATLLGDAVYVLGGLTCGERPLRDVHVLDVSSMRWSQPAHPNPDPNPNPNPNPDPDPSPSPSPNPNPNPNPDPTRTRTLTPTPDPEQGAARGAWRAPGGALAPLGHAAARPAVGLRWLDERAPRERRGGDGQRSSQAGPRALPNPQLEP